MTTFTTPTRFEGLATGATAGTGGNSTGFLSATISTTSALPVFYQAEELTFLWILFVIIVVGNATVLVTLLLSKGHKSRMNFFIKHLAATDLCVGLISVLTDIIWKITISWDAGLVACKIIRFLQCVVTYSSNYVLVALSIDRYDAITHPMNFSGSWRRARILVAVAWLLSCVFSSPILLLYHTKETEGYGTQCWIQMEKPWQWQLYFTLIFLALFFIPTLLISGCYINIVCTIWKKGKAMQTTCSSTQGASSAMASGAAAAAAGGNSANSEEPESRRASSRGLIPKAKVKTVKMTFVIIFVFILCWSPYMIFDLLQVYKVIDSANPALATFIQSLAHLNSAANPLIYCLFSTNIGASFCNILCCRRKAEPLPTGLTTSTHSTSQSTRPLVGHSRALANPARVEPQSSSVTFRTAASIEG